MYYRVINIYEVVLASSYELACYCEWCQFRHLSPRSSSPPVTLSVDSPVRAINSVEAMVEFVLDHGVFL